MATLREWKAQGRISYVGVTHYTDAAHGELEAVMRREVLDFVQFNYSIADRAAGHVRAAAHARQRRSRDR